MDYPFGYSHDAISKYIDYSVFIDTPLDVALARRTIRDYDSTNARNIINDMKQYLAQGRDAYLHSINLKSAADFVVDGCKSIDDIVMDIKEKVILESSV